MKLTAPKFKIKTVIFQRIGKVLLWTLVVFLILRGIGTLFNPNDAEAAKNVIDDFIQSNTYKERVEFEAAAFAEGFAIEFMSYDGRNHEDHSKRLQKYLPGYIGSLNMNIKSGVKAEALSSETEKINWISDQQLNVDVKVKVRYLIEKQSDGSTPGEMLNQENVTDSDVHIRIPVVEKDGKYLIEDYPAFIPGPDKAEIEFKYFSGKEASSDVVKQISEVLENFYRTYYEGNSGEIRYYLLDSTKEIKGLGQRYGLYRLDSVSVYIKEDTPDRYFALVNLTVRDSINGQEIPQRFHVSVVKKEDRYYVETFDVRVGNLNDFKSVK